ncbi:MAG: glycoside hydrolase family 65 protein [Bacillota bacterium]
MRKYHRKKLEKEALYKYEPWHISEDKFKTENNHRNESIFSIGNGYIGMRGTLEEDYTGEEGTSTPGIYINGVYASEEILYGEEAPQQPKWSQTIVNQSDWSVINVYIDDEKFDLLNAKIENYKRRLDIRNGCLNRELIWETSNGKRLQMKFSRFLSMSEQHIGVIKLSLKPLNFTGKIEISSAVDIDVKNHHHLREPKVLDLQDAAFIEDEGLLYLKQRINSSNISIATAVINQLEVGDGVLKSHNNNLNHTNISSQENGRFKENYQIEVKENSEIKLKKYISFYTSNDIGEEKLVPTVCHSVKNALNKGYENLFIEHKKYLEEYWDDIDIVIKGDLAAQQAFRYNALQILQSTGRDKRTNLSAKGLTGEFYEGHYFWDTETYAVPFFLYSKADIARNLLLYRYNTLDQARENAKRVRVQGALFPWRTINGQESSAFFMGSTVQFHINADIAYAIYQYYNVTLDKEFLYKYGIEILVETARMWASRGSYISKLNDQYCFNEVCGPDEYKPGVSNNCYTNYMAKFNIEYTLDCVRMLKEENMDRYQELAQKINLKDFELARWQQIAEDIYLPYDEEYSIHPQDDSFLYKDEIDLDSLDDDNFPLVANWHPLTIWRFQVIKQADVILLMFLLGNKFSLEEKKANYDFYEPRTTHDSSLSPAIYSIVAVEVGYYEEAYNYFLQTIRLDLDDYNENTWKGLHLAAMGSSWLALVQGFAGMRVYENKLHFLPYIPDDWDSYQFKIKYRGAQIKICVKKEEVKYSLLNGENIEFIHNGQKCKLSKDSPELSLA